MSRGDPQDTGPREGKPSTKSNRKKSLSKRFAFYRDHCGFSEEETGTPAGGQQEVCRVKTKDGGGDNKKSPDTRHLRIKLTRAWG